jgi:hypothetical protein
MDRMPPASEEGPGVTTRELDPDGLWMLSANPSFLFFVLKADDK